MGNKYNGGGNSSDDGDDEADGSDRSAGADGESRERADAVVQDAVREAAAETEAADDGPSDAEVLQDTFGDVSGFGGGKAAALASAGYSSEDDVRRARTEELQAVESVGEATARELSQAAALTDEHAPNPSEDLPRFRADENVTRTIEDTNSEPGEGFTLYRDLKEQPLGDTDEWLVGATADVQTAPITKDGIEEVYRKYQEELRDFSSVRIGGYHHEEGGKYAVEVSLAFSDKATAREIGEQLDQESIFNIGTFDLVDTGGEGNSPIDSPEDLRHFLTNMEVE